MRGRPIYMDYQATTPMDPRVLEAMMPYFTERFGNPHSASHMYGWEGEAALDVAREQVSDLIGGGSGEVIFTSGATEANNFALKGVMEAYQASRPHLVVASAEHSCVLNTAKMLEAKGARLTIVPVDGEGVVDLAALKDAVTDETALVSIMAVNNEVGAVAPLAQVAEIAHAKGALLHTDAAQAVGKIALDMDTLGVDLLSLSGHKMYGPKGVGALWRRDERRVALVPQTQGGGQERGWRSGTQAPALVAGLGKAADLAQKDRAQEETRLLGMAKRLFGAVSGALNGVALNGPALEGGANRRWAGNLSLAFEGARADLLMSNLRDVAVSAGSACASKGGAPSHVLTAMGFDKPRIQSTLRVGMGRMTTDADVDKTSESLIRAVRQARGEASEGGERRR